MDEILVVDSDRENLKNIEKGFKKLKALKLLTAVDAKTAVDILKNTKVSVFVSGMDLPDFDGVEIMAYMSRTYPSIPCIAMLEPGQRRPWFAESARHADILHFIEKPFEFDSLVEMIIAAKGLKDGGRTSEGMSLKNFLPLLEITAKTCQVGVKTGKKKGTLYFLKGGLSDARFENMLGEAAAMEMIGWDTVKISISKLPSTKKEGRVEFALMDKIGVTWEKQEEVSGFPLPQPPDEPPPDPATISKLERSLEKYVGVLKTVKGYMGLAVLSPAGKVLASDVAGKPIDFEKFSADFTAILNQCGETSGRKGLKRCTGITVHTQEAIIIMMAADTTYKHGNYRFMGMMAPEGNGFFMRVQLENIIPQILRI